MGSLLRLARNVSVVALVLCGCAQQWPEHVVMLHPFQAEVSLAFQRRELVEARVLEIPRSTDLRASRLVEMFRQAGCPDDQITLQRSRRFRYPNVSCFLPGATPQVIVVGAYHTKPRTGRGLADNWTGAAMLPSLYFSLASQPRHYSYDFVSFAEPDESYGGVHEYLKTISGEEIEAFVSLSTLGIDELCFSGSSDPELLMDLISAGKAIDVRVRRRSLSFTMHEPTPLFRRHDIPAILVHSFDRRMARVYDKYQLDRSDQWIDPERYFSSYRAIALYLAYLGHSLPARLQIESTRGG